MVEVIIPYGGDCPFRARALSSVTGRYPWPVTVARFDGPWCKAAAVMPAVERSTADVVVVADADVWSDGTAGAVQAVRDGAAWAIPHWLVHRLGENGEPCEKPYEGVIGGGIVAAPRDTLLKIPLDPRFVGWGQEDESWGAALRTLTGEPWRGTADLYHYWHPPQPRLSRTRGSREGWNLRRRYLRARRAPDQMRQLIEEAHAALATLEQADHDHLAHRERVH